MDFTMSDMVDRDSFHNVATFRLCDSFHKVGILRLAVCGVCGGGVGCSVCGVWCRVVRGVCCWG